MATRPKKKTESEIDIFSALAKQLPHMGQDELVELLGDLKPLRAKDSTEAEHEASKAVAQQRVKAPTNDDELHALIIELTGFNIPRTAVCHDHCAPFDPIADAYFNRENAILVMASRESGKTLTVSVLHFVNAETKPGCEGITFGAIKPQALRAYQYVKDFVFSRDDEGNRIPKPQILGEPTREKTEWKTGSIIQLIVGTRCLPRHAKVVTPNGSVKIQDIVNQRLPGPIRSFNYETNEWEWREVVNWFRNGKTDKWLRVKLEIGSRGNDLTSTPEHEVLTPDGEKREIGSMSVGDKIMVRGETFSDEQQQVLMGSLLGDGHITAGNRSTGGRGGHRYRVTQSQQRWPYLEWIADSFSEFNPTYFRREAKKTRDVDFACNRTFHEARLEWYPKDIKRMPDRVWSELGPLGLAVWLMDDGSVAKFKAGRPSGRGQTASITWSIAALHMNAHERAMAQAYFDDLGVDGRWSCVDRETDGWTWVATNEGSLTLQSIVAPYIDISEKQPKGWKRWIAEPIAEHSTDGLRAAQIRSIESVEMKGSNSERYDITVDHNHNFLLATGVLVGNSGVNSPHPQVVHADELDLMEEDVFEESRNMAQPLDTVIPTPDGPCRFGDLERGDLVFGSDGRPTAVLDVYQLGEREVFRVDFTDGRSTECCGDHLWKAGYVSSYGERKWGVHKLRDLDRISTPDPRGGQSYRWAIPQQQPVTYLQERLDAVIHPYVLGVLIGDGCIRRRLAQFRSNDQHIVNQVRDLLPDGVGVYLTAQDPPVYRITRGPAGKSGAKSSPNPIVAELERLGLEGADSHTKFIPRQYLEAPMHDRLALLQGLMDTDGSYTKDPYFATVSERLALDVKELVLGLGGRALMRKKDATSSSFSNCGYFYEVSASLPPGFAPFSLPRKLEKMKPRQRTLDPSIRSVTFVGVKDVRCITVDRADGIYLTTDFLVTHNSSSKTLPGGKRIPALDIVTSTRKSTRGLMQKLLDETEEAISQGHKPPWKVYAFCYKESAAEVPSCRVADPVDRIRRLMELGQDPNQLCRCNTVVKGEWGPGVPRTLESCCRGDLFRARGWMHIDDIERKFSQNSQAKWEAQMECRRPMADGLYLPSFSRVRHCVRQWVPRPEYGKIFQGVDWGGADTSVVHWVQGPLLMPVQITGYDMRQVVVPQGAYVVFKSRYWFERVGATRMADEVVTIEIGFRDKFPGWRVKGRFADMAGAQQRNDWHEHSPPLRTHWYITRDFDPSVETVQELMTENLLYVDVGAGSQTASAELADDFEGWRSKNGKEVHDATSHGPAALRYCLGNVVVIERRREKENGKRQAMPAVAARASDAVDRAGLSPAVGSTGQVETEAWRRSMGMMTNNQGSEGWRI